MNQSGYWFSDEDYSAILDNLVVVCVDTLLYDSRGRIYLGMRKRLPLLDWWIFGGRMQAKETNIEAAQRGLEREVAYLPKNAPELIGYFDLKWDRRAEVPQEHGCHVLLAAMKCKLEDDEVDLVQAQGEDHSEGRWFSQNELMQTELNPYLTAIIRQSQIL